MVLPDPRFEQNIGGTWHLTASENRESALGNGDDTANHPRSVPRRQRLNELSNSLRAGCLYWSAGCANHAHVVPRPSCTTRGGVCRFPKVIDPEFAFYGPMGFDIGALIGNLLLAYCAVPGNGQGEEYGEWLLEQVCGCVCAWLTSDQRAISSCFCWSRGGAFHIFPEYLFVIFYREVGSFAPTPSARRVLGYCGLKHGLCFDRLLWMRSSYALDR